MEPGQGVRPGKAQIILILLWTSIAMLVGELGTFSIPFVEKASLFWPAMVFQTVGGLWFGGLGILSAMIFPLVSNALGGFPWPQNLAWISGNFIQGGLLRFYFQYRGWDPSLPTGKEIRGFILIGAILSNVLGVLVTMILLSLTPYGLPWSESLTLLCHFHYRQRSALHPAGHSPVEIFFTSGHHFSALFPAVMADQKVP